MQTSNLGTFIVAYFLIVFWNSLEVEFISLCVFVEAPLFVEEVVDVVPFGLRARCELFVLHARLVGILLLPLDFVAASAVAAAAVAAASQQLCCRCRQLAASG